MELVLFLAGLIVLDILANALGPDSRELEHTLRIEGRTRRDAPLTARQ